MVLTIPSKSKPWLRMGERRISKIGLRPDPLSSSCAAMSGFSIKRSIVPSSHNSGDATFLILFEFFRLPRIDSGLYQGNRIKIPKRIQLSDNEFNFKNLTMKAQS